MSDPSHSVPFATNSIEIVAQRNVPPINGLHFEPTLLMPDETCAQLIEYLESTFFTSLDINQVMLFGTADETDSGIPPYLEMLLLELSEMLLPHLPHDVHKTVFESRKEGEGGTLGPSRARQVILNRYNPGEGITPHVDLLKRFDDGILGVSLGSGCVMDFEPVSGNDFYDKQQKFGLYLPPGSILVLTGEARYKWTHGIAKRTEDPVFSVHHNGPEMVERRTRMSLTFRWLLPDAHIVGGGEE